MEIRSDSDDSVFAVSSLAAIWKPISNCDIWRGCTYHLSKKKYLYIDDISLSLQSVYYNKLLDCMVELEKRWGCQEISSLN